MEKGVMLTNQPSSSTFASTNNNTLTTKANFEALGRKFIRNMCQVSNDMSDEGKKVTKTIEEFFCLSNKSDLELNIMNLAAEQVMERMTDHSAVYLRRPKRKTFVSYQEEAA